MKKESEKRNPYRQLGTDKISAPVPEKNGIGATVRKGNDLRSKGGK